MLTSICPILPSRDFDATIDFYDALGFQLRGRYDESGYLILSRDQVEIHFFRFVDHIPAQSDHGAYLRVTDANALSNEFAQLGLPAAGAPRFVLAENKPWGMCELAIIDPDGNLLRMGHIL